MEQITEKINDLFVSWGFDSSEVGPIMTLVLIIGIAFLADLICRNILLRVVAKLVKKTKATWDDIVFDRKSFDLPQSSCPSHHYLCVDSFGNSECKCPRFYPSYLHDLYHLRFLLRFISAFLSAVYHVYSEREQFRDRPLKGLLQTAQVILFFIGGIVVISVLIDKSPMVLLTGLGASAAILMLVFKDSIMGFVSGIQLSANNMLKVGDWIAMPKYGADGTVIEVTLNTVKVRNWDNTITTIPPYLLVSDSFQNWRGMQESGGRRVKRSINIDMNSVRFCTPEMLAKYKKIQLLTDYVEQTEQVVKEYNEEHHIDNSILVNGRRQTNLGVFRAYLTNYLKSLPDVNKNLTCMVRYLQPTEQGIPVELYFFSAVKEWVPYEGIQADVFDHLLAIVPEFGLRVFQNPTGEDFREWNRRN